MASYRAVATLALLLAVAPISLAQDEATKQAVPGISAPPPSQQVIAKPHSAPRPAPVEAPQPVPVLPTPVIAPVVAPTATHDATPKPVAKPVAHTPIAAAKPRVHIAPPTPKPVPAAVVHVAPPAPKPAPAPVVHAAPPAPKPAPVVHVAPPAPKPVPAAVVLVAPPAPKPAPAPVVHVAPPPAPAPTSIAAVPPQPSVKAASPVVPAPDVLDAMTRDGGSESAPAEPAAMNPVGQIVRMLGALLIVLLLVYVAVLLLKKYRSTAVAVPDSTPVVPKPTGSRSIADLLAGTQVATKPTAGKSTLAPLEIVSAQDLPGSGAMIYLVKAANRMILIGASANGGVRTLAEWDIEETRTVEEQNASFDAYLRAQGVLLEPAEELSDIGAVRSRLHQAATRLSRKIDSDTGEKETIAR